MRFRPYHRTIVLAVLACAVFLWAAAERFDVPPAELGWMLVLSAAGVVFVAILAAVAFALRLLLRRWFKGR